MSELPFQLMTTRSMKSEPIFYQENEYEADETNKCGEVFAQYGGNFILICGFCHDTHENMIAFSVHVNEKHEDKMRRIKSYLESTHDDKINEIKIEGHANWTDVEETFSHEIGSDACVDYLPESIKTRAKMGIEIMQQSAEQPVKFVCEHCGQSYKYKGRLRTHQMKNSCKGMMSKKDNIAVTTTCSDQPSNPAVLEKIGNARQSSKLDEFVVESEVTKFESTVQENEETMAETFDAINAVECETKSDQEPTIGEIISKNERLDSNEEDNLLIQVSDAKALEQFPCGTCDRSFKSKQARNYHRRRFHEKQLSTGDPKSSQDLRCKYCNKEFATKAECIEHEGTHIGEKRFICWYCPHTFRTNYGRKRHMRVHTGERPFKCTECPKAFPHMVQLDYHIRKHKNLREFSCKTCGKAFFRKFELGLHERKHTGFRPLVCEDCGKTFNVMSELNEHRKRHTDKKDWKCEICSKCFYSKWTLKDHMAGHSSETPFGCDVCGRKFSRAKALKKHKKLHSDVKAYVCNICGKAYAQDSGLYAHKKTQCHVNIINT